MTIIINCLCGKQFRAEEQDAGLQAKCPACQRLLTIPGQPRVHRDSATDGPSGASGTPTAAGGWGLPAVLAVVLLSVALVVAVGAAIYFASRRDASTRPPVGPIAKGDPAPAGGASSSGESPPKVPSSNQRTIEPPINPPGEIVPVPKPPEEPNTSSRFPRFPGLEPPTLRPGPGPGPSPSLQFPGPEPPREDEKSSLDAVKLTLSTPSGVHTLRVNRSKYRVVEVAANCTLEQFSPDESETLRKYVADGGIVWANNNVLALFDLKYESYPWGTTVTTAAISGDVCALVRGCSRVALDHRHEGARDLRGQHVIPLLVGEEETVLFGPRVRHTYWSIARYGRGYVINIKPLDVRDPGAAKFQLNFNSFCLGEPSPVPGVPWLPDEPPPGAPGPPAEPLVVTTANELEDALRELPKQRVLWIQLTKAEVPSQSVEQLRDWVSRGGVLWLDTDLGRLFGFKLSAPPPTIPGVFVAGTGHPVLKGLEVDTRVSVVMGPNPLVIAGSSDELSRLTPLLGWTYRPPRGPRRVFLACALRSEGRGFVVYRPRQIEETDAGKLLEDNLRRWSFQQAARLDRQVDAESEDRANGRNAAPTSPPESPVKRK